MKTYETRLATDVDSLENVNLIAELFRFCLYYIVLCY